MTDREKLIEILSKYFDIGDSDTYVLTRVKEGFTVGTITIDDFKEFDEENVADLADYILKHKSDEVTLRLDLGDRSAEEIKKIAEAFNGDIKKHVAKEILQEVWNTGGTILAIQQLAAKYGVEVE